jgi:hypothetical protein
MKSSLSVLAILSLILAGCVTPEGQQAFNKGGYPGPFHYCGFWGCW